MPHADLSGCLLKLERARTHIAELDSQVETFLDENPFGQRAEQRTLEGGIVESVVTVSIERQPPPEWALIIGDAVQNTRIALEYLAYELTPEEHRGHTEFPICTTKAAFAKKASKLTWIDDRSRLLVENVQPCFWPVPRFSPLATLQTLSNQDKHNLLISLATGRSGREYVGASVPIAEGSFRMSVGAVTHGQQVMRFSARPEEAGATLTLEPHVELQIIAEAFPDSSIVALVSGLHHYVRHVIVEPYERGYTPPKPESL